MEEILAPSKPEELVMVEDREDEKKNGPSINLSLKDILPYLLIIGSWCVNYGRSDNSAIVLKQQVDTETTIVSKLSEDLKILTVQVAHLDQTIKDMNDGAIQDRAYRENISKNKR